MIMTINDVRVALWEFEQRLCALSSLVRLLPDSKYQSSTGLDCSVGIVARLQVRRFRIRYSISSVKASLLFFFIFPPKIQPDSEAHPSSYGFVWNSFTTSFFNLLKPKTYITYHQL